MIENMEFFVYPVGAIGGRPLRSAGILSVRTQFAHTKQICILFNKISEFYKILFKSHEVKNIYFTIIIHICNIECIFIKFNVV